MARQFKRRDQIADEERTPATIKAAEKKLAMARITLLRTFPLFGEISVRMQVKPTYSIHTTAVDQHKTFWYNPEWICLLSRNDVISSTAHEIGHLIQDLFSRTPAVVIPHIWNAAADDMVDTMMIDAGVEGGEWRKSKCTPEIQEKARAARTTEQRYRERLQEMEQSECPACAQMAKMALNGEIEEHNEGDENCGCGCKEDGDKKEGEQGGEPREDEGKGGSSNKEGGPSKPEHTCGRGEHPCCTATMMGQEKLTPQQQAEINSKWRTIIVGAALAAQSRGDIPGELEEFLAKLSKPKVDWRDHVRLMATSVFNDRYTYYRRARRAYAMGLILPGRTKATKGAVGVFDTSFSMSDGELHRCFSEFVGLMEQCGCPQLEVIFHDAVVYYQGEHTKFDMGKIKVQRGGTDHRPVFERLNDKKRKEPPAMVVCFTDLETVFPEELPSYPVLWCCPESSKDHKVPFGKKIVVNMED